MFWPGEKIPSVHLVCSPTPIQVSEWHKKLEEARLQELRKNRELVARREEIKYLKNLVVEQERSISSLEEDLVQQNNVKRYHLMVTKKNINKCWLWRCFYLCVCVVAVGGAAALLGSERGGAGATAGHVRETAEPNYRIRSEGPVSIKMHYFTNIFQNYSARSASCASI